MWHLYALYNSKWVDILSKSNNIGWGSDKDTLAVSLSFESLYNLEEGTHITLKKDSKVVFLGLVISKNKGKFKNSYTCMDYAFYLNKNKLIIQFNKVNGTNAIKQLCSKLGIKSNIVQINTLITKIHKDSEASKIIEDILEQSHLETNNIYIKEMISDTLYIRKLSDLKIKPKILIGKDITVNSTIENMFTKVIVVSSDEKNNRVLASVEDKNNILKFGMLQEIITVAEKKDESKAKNMANNFLKENNKVAKDVTIPLVVGNLGEDIIANRMINISIPTMGVDGWYRIKSASHTLAKNNHKVSISIEF